MLARLSIRDVVLIDQLDLDFAAGLTVLTGETGAGKSILLDALSLALGARGDGGLVRQGQPQGQVTAVFELPFGHAAHAALEGRDIEIADQLILRRVQLADGRTRAYVNDQSVSAQSIRELASALVEIHGQHDERALTDPAAHRALVDAYGGLESLVEATASAFAALRDAERALDAERRRVLAAAADAEFARHAYDELSRLAVQPGEEEALASRRQAMMQGEKVAADVRDARDHLAGDASILPVLLSLSRRLQRRMPQAPDLIEPSVRALDEAIPRARSSTRAPVGEEESERPERAVVEEVRGARARPVGDERVVAVARDRAERAGAVMHLQRRRAEAEAVRRVPALRLPERVHRHDALVDELDREALRGERRVREVPRLPRAVVADAEVVAEGGSDGVRGLPELDPAERASRHERPGPRQSRGRRHGERGRG